MTNMIFIRNPQTIRNPAQIISASVHIWKYNLQNQYKDMHPEMSDVPQDQKKEKDHLLKLNI